MNRTRFVLATAAVLTAAAGLLAPSPTASASESQEQDCLSPGTVDGLLECSYRESSAKIVQVRERVSSPTDNCVATNEARQTLSFTYARGISVYTEKGTFRRENVKLKVGPIGFGVERSDTALTFDQNTTGFSVSSTFIGAIPPGWRGFWEARFGALESKGYVVATYANVMDPGKPIEKVWGSADNPSLTIVSPLHKPGDGSALDGELFFTVEPCADVSL